MNFPVLTVEPAEQADTELLSTVATMAPLESPTSNLLLGNWVFAAQISAGLKKGMQIPMSCTFNCRKRVPTC